MADVRLKNIFYAGSRLFINQGYSQTKISHIAKEAGISIGAVYMMFTSKKVIFDFILKVTLDPEFLDSEQKLPMSEDLFADIKDEMKEVFNNNNHRFAEHLTNNLEEYPFAQMLSDAFDMVSRYAVGCLLFEKNQNACGELGQYYIQYRKQFFNVFYQYVSLYILQGTVRALEYPEYGTSLMIETIAWWAMHVQQNAFEVQKKISMETAKSVCMDALTHAYCI